MAVNALLAPALFCTSFQCYSLLPNYSYQHKCTPTHIFLDHHHFSTALRQCRRSPNARNFVKNNLGFPSFFPSSMYGLNFNRREILHLNSRVCHIIPTNKSHTRHTDANSKEMDKQALTILSTLLLAFLIQQPHLSVSSAISQQPNANTQPNQQRHQTKMGPEIMQTDLGNVIDIAKVLSPGKASQLRAELQALEENSGWKLRILTRSGPSPSPSDKFMRDLWHPDDKTLIVVEDVSAPNILNFGTGSAVASRLPRQFFNELQSRYGNQFFVSEEGDQTALLDAIEAIKQCIVKEEGCNNVPGLTNDLYFLTLATSIAGGSVFGFAARLPPQGRVEASWQWAILLSPLWMLLFVSFGILPIVGRTSDWDPLLKNGVGFLGAAAAFYLTPIFGRSPIEKKQ